MCTTNIDKERLKVTHCLLYFVDVIFSNSKPQISNVVNKKFLSIGTSELILLMQGAAVQERHNTEEEEGEHDHLFTLDTGR